MWWALQSMASFELVSFPGVAGKWKEVAMRGGTPGESCLLCSRSPWGVGGSRVTETSPLTERGTGFPLSGLESGADLMWLQVCKVPVTHAASFFPCTHTCCP